MADLLRALQLHLGDLPDLAAKLTYMDTFQEICSLDNFTINTPTEEDVVKMLAIGEDVRAVLQPYLYDSTPQ
jgi:hypothetical protein